MKNNLESLIYKRKWGCFIVGLFGVFLAALGIGVVQFGITVLKILLQSN